MGDFFDALTKYHNKREPLHETTAVLCYEVGNMLEHAMYMYWNEADKGDVMVHRGFLISELMDAIAQCELICESLGMDFNELRELGKEKALERFTGKEKKH